MNQPSGRLFSGMTSDESNMAVSGLTGGLDIASNLYFANREMQQNRKNRKEDLKLAEITRQDTLDKNAKKNLLKTRSIEQEEENFKINKFIEDQNLRHELYIQKMKEAIESRKKLVSAFTSMKEDASSNAELRNVILSSFRRK